MVLLTQGGRRTLSITWTIPFIISISASITSASVLTNIPVSSSSVASPKVKIISSLLRVVDFLRPSMGSVIFEEGTTIGRT